MFGIYALETVTSKEWTYLISVDDDNPEPRVYKVVLAFHKRFGYWCVRAIENQEVPTIPLEGVRNLHSHRNKTSINKVIIVKKTKENLNMFV